MSDQLKQFIERNRGSFDSEEPGSALYKRISEGLSQTRFKKKSSWQQWGWAAAVSAIILLSVGYYAFSLKDKKQVTPVVKDEQPSPDINFIGDVSYAKKIEEFRELIGLKQSELKVLKDQYPDLYKQFVTDINELDSSYQSLKTKLAANPNREMLLEAMLQNLQLQSELLNRQLQIIKEIKQKTKSHEKSIS
jgi:hypothetical protein